MGRVQAGIDTRVAAVAFSTSAMNLREAPKLALSILALLLLVACGGGSSGSGAPEPPEPAAYTYSVPANRADGWQVADISSEGFESQQIIDMMERVVSERFEGLDSVTIVRNNKLLLYWFANRELDEFDDWIGNTNGERHVLHSTSKSFTSALVGIAIDQGYIDSTQVSFYDLFDYTTYSNWDPRKAEMTLEDVLTMRLGLQWDEWTLPYTDTENDLVALTRAHLDWAKALLDLPMVNDPGAVFVYNTAATNALGQAVQNATGMPLAEFANVNLFYPMQITDAEWSTTPVNLPVGGSGLFLRTRDLVKFGQLYLDNGSWQGQQLISADWIADSVVRRVDISSWARFSEAYGFQWWLDDFHYNGETIEAWVTSGYGGQYMFVVPSLDLVVGFTGHNYDFGPGIENLYFMMQHHIIDAIN
jgi:CubicO group peptidase (beta-lactamase class C family)